MAFISSVVAVSFYFDKRRSIAIGIAVCGTGVGTFALAPLINALLSEYSWKGTALIQGGLLLNCIICGMLFRPLPNILIQKIMVRPPVNETVTIKVDGAEEPIMEVKCASTLELPHALHDVKSRRQYNESEKSTLSHMSYGQSTDPLLHKNMLYASRLDHDPECWVEPEDYLGSTSLKQEPESHSGKCWLAKSHITTSEREGTPTNVAGSEETRLKVTSAANIELPQTWAASSRNVKNKRRLSGSDRLAMLHTSSAQLLDPVSHKKVFCTRSLDRVPQYRAVRDDYVRSTSTQLEPEFMKSSLAKIGITKEETGKPLNAVECEQPRMKAKSASNLELPQTSSASSLDVESRRRYSESEKSTAEKEKPTVMVEFGEPRRKVMSSKDDVELMQTLAALSENVARERKKTAMSCTLSTQPADTLIQKNGFRTRSLDRIPQNRNEYDRSTTSLKEHRESRMSISWPVKINVADVEQEKAEDLVTGGEPRIVTKCAFRVELSQMSAASSRNDRRRHSESVKPTLSHTHSTELTGTAAHNHVFHTRSLDRILQHRAECDDCARSSTSQSKLRRNKSWLAVTKEKEDNSANVVDSAEPRIIGKTVSCTHLTSPRSHHSVFYTKSLDCIPQYWAERDEYDRSMSSTNEQPEPGKDQNRLTKIGMTEKEERKQTNPAGTELPNMIDTSAGLIQMSAVSTPDVEYKQRFIKLKKSIMSHTSSTRLAGLTSHKNVFRNWSFRRVSKYPAEREDYVGSTTSLTEQPGGQSDSSWLEKMGMAEEEQRKPTNPAGTERPKMKDKSASNLDLSQMSAVSTPEVERRQRFIKLKKSVISDTPTTRLAGFTAQKNVFRNRSLRRIPLYRAERHDYVGSTTSLTEQPKRQADSSWLEKIGVTNERKEIPANVIQSGQPRMKVKSASTLDLTHTHAAPSTNATRRRRRLSDSEKSTVSRKSTVSLRSLENFAGRVTQPALFYAISLEHIPPYRIDSDSDDGSVTSNKSWPEKIGNAKKMRQRVSKMMIFRLFLDSVFVLFVISTFLTGIAFVVPYVFLPNRGLRLGFDSQQSSWLISAVGISNMIGRLVFGFVASIEQVNSLILYSTLLIISGICSLFSVLLTTYPLQMCYAICYGFVISKSVVL